jgi:hypothetical protein
VPDRTAADLLRGALAHRTRKRRKKSCEDGVAPPTADLERSMALLARLSITSEGKHARTLADVPAHDFDF